MTKAEVFALLESKKDERGIKNFEKMGPEGITSFGIGLTQLRKLGKEIGKDHALAQELWASNNYEARILATIIDDPKQVNREQVQKQVSEISFWMMAHAYCSSLMPKLPFQRELSDEWRNSTDDIQRRAAYLMLYNMAKDDKKLPDSYFEPIIDTIEAKLQQEENFVKDAMNAALLAIGKRSAQLNKRCIKAGRNIGKVEVDYGDNSCMAPDIVKHLESPALQDKFKA